MAGSKDFTAGSITLTNFIADTTSLNPNFRSSGNSPFINMLIQTGASFDFNWGPGNATDGVSHSLFTGFDEPPQQVGGAGSDTVQLTLRISPWLSGPTPTVENVAVLVNGAQTIAAGNTVDSVVFNETSGASLGADLQTVEFLDTTPGDHFQVHFTLVDVTANATTTFSEAFRVAICYVTGARVATPAGETAVEDLQIGDLVLTAAGAAKPVKWIGRLSHTADSVTAAHQLRPVVIRQDALGSGLPRRDLMVSPMHALFIDDSFVPASALVNGVSILRSESEAAVDYVHIELHDHDVILAEAVPAETFVDDDSRTMFDNVSEYYDLYGTSDSRRGYSVPRLEEGYRLEGIRRRIAARAGIAPSAAVPGTMAGHVERLDGGELEGWIMDQANPTNPVELEVLVDGEIVATVLANRYRPDLDRAGLADGRCAFSLVMPAAAEDVGQVSVRRASDGSQVTMPARTSVTV
jgi:hypothetical protein